MIESVKTVIKNFDFPYFVAAFVRNRSKASLKISKQNGIRCEKTIKACYAEFEKFKKNNTYSKETVENYFGVRFVNARVEKNEITYLSPPFIGSDIIYIHQR